MLGRYRINHANTVFPGAPGTVFQAQDGPMLSAAVRAGAVSRIDPQSREDARPGPSPTIGDNVTQPPQETTPPPEETVRTQEQPATVGGPPADPPTETAQPADTSDAEAPAKRGSKKGVGDGSSNP